MTVDEAIEALGLLRILDAPELAEAVNMAIKALRAQQNGGWISVKKRLPEERSGQNQEFNVMVKGFSRATALCYKGE